MAELTREKRTGPCQRTPPATELEARLDCRGRQQLWQRLGAVSPATTIPPQMGHRIRSGARSKHLHQRWFSPYGNLLCERLGKRRDSE